MPYSRAGGRGPVPGSPREDGDGPRFDEDRGGRGCVGRRGGGAPAGARRGPGDAPRAGGVAARGRRRHRPRRQWARRARVARARRCPRGRRSSGRRAAHRRRRRPHDLRAARAATARLDGAARRPARPAARCRVRRDPDRAALRCRGRPRGTGRAGGLPRRGSRHELAADLVVGADGVDSRVRDGGRFGARLAAPGIPYLRAVVSSAPALGEEAWTAAGLFGSFAVADGVYVYASAGSRRTREAHRGARSRSARRRLGGGLSAVGPLARRRRALRGSRDPSGAAGRLRALARRPARAGGRRRARHGAEPRPGCEQRAGRCRRVARRAAPQSDPDGGTGCLRGAPSPRGPPGGGGCGPPRSPRRVDAPARTARARSRPDAARLPSRAPERSRPPAPGAQRDAAGDRRRFG